MAIVGGVLIPTDPKNAWLLGFSRTRIILISLLILFEVVFTAFSIAYRCIKNMRIKTENIYQTFLSSNVYRVFAFYVSILGSTIGLALLIITIATEDAYIKNILLRVAPLLFVFSVLNLQMLFLLLRSTLDLGRKFSLQAMGFSISMILLTVISFEKPSISLDKLLVVDLFVIVGMTLLLAKINFSMDSTSSQPLVGILILSLLVKSQLFFIGHKYNTQILHYAPVIISTAWMILYVIKFLLSSSAWQKVIKIGLSALFLAGMAYFYHAASAYGAEFNTNIIFGDQLKMVNISREAKANNFHVKNNGTQTPLYPIFQAIFINPDQDRDEVFEQGKLINIYLAMGLLIGYCFVFARKEPRHQAVNLMLITAFALYIFKAPFFQAEVLYFFLVFSSYLLMIQLFSSKSLILPVLTGVVSGLAFLAKASMLGMLYVYIIVFAAKILLNYFSRDKNSQVFRENSISLFQIA
ncbi:hypothetical protein ACFLYP_01565, partial [Chloroflexota bacterium]